MPLGEYDARGLCQNGTSAADLKFLHQ
jgi:hypothetical protein